VRLVQSAEGDVPQAGDVAMAAPHMEMLETTDTLLSAGAAATGPLPRSSREAAHTSTATAWPPQRRQRETGKRAESLGPIGTGSHKGSSPAPCESPSPPSRHPGSARTDIVPEPANTDPATTTDPPPLIPATVQRNRGRAEVRHQGQFTVRIGYLTPLLHLRRHQRNVPWRGRIAVQLPAGGDELARIRPMRTASSPWRFLLATTSSASAPGPRPVTARARHKLDVGTEGVIHDRDGVLRFGIGSFGGGVGRSEMLARFFV